MKRSSSHRISRGWNHRWSVQKQCGTFLRDWRWGLADRLSRGNNKLAPERIRWARGGRLHIIWRVSACKEQRPTLLSNTQSKAPQFNPPKSSHKTYCAWRRMVPLKIQNLTTSASLIFVGQCCVFKYRGNTMSSEGGGIFNQFTLWGEGGRCCWGSQWRWPGQGC